LPWDWIATGVSKEFLIRERQRASQGQYTPGRCTGRCAECGLCGELRADAGALPESGFEPARDRPHPPEENRPPPIAVPAAGDPQTRLRFGYRKQAPASTLSHLETLNVFQRALRRAGLPLAYTEGEHPHPRASFSPALSVGIESLAEYLDIWFCGPVAAGDAADRLNAELPEGYSVFQAGPVALPAPSLEESIAWIEYELTFPGLGDLPGACELLARALEDRGATSPPPRESEAPGNAPRTHPLHGATLELAAPGPRLRCRLFRTGGSMPSPTRILEALPPDLLPGGLRPRILKTQTAFLEPFSGFPLQTAILSETREPGTPDR